MSVRAILWNESPAMPGVVLCHACAHFCRIGEGANGRCRVRVNHKGTLYSLSADRLASVNLDPVEKKPLYHFLPGSMTLSLGTPGCNMRCAFCQNHSLSQGQIPRCNGFFEGFPASFAPRVMETARNAGAESLSFTYNEPLINPELLTTMAPAARESGLSTILVSNAFASGQSMSLLRDMINAANFDLKSFRDEFYADLCGARLKPVLQTIVRAREFGWWMELTTLLIPGVNDSDEELTGIARFIKENLGENVPWHISRFRPIFKMADIPPTPVAAVDRALEIGMAEGLLFVYAGNVSRHDATNTRCPSCGSITVQRLGYETEILADGLCPECGRDIPGVWRKA